MTADRIRTSLSSAPSAVTEEERAVRMKRLELRIWREHQALVVRASDLDGKADSEPMQKFERELWERQSAIVARMSDPGMETIVEAIGQTRFGKREQRA